MIERVLVHRTTETAQKAQPNLSKFSVAIIIRWTVQKRLLTELSVFANNLFMYFTVYFLHI